MATENNRRPTRRKPTKRAARRRTTKIDAHYSKLTRTSTLESTRRNRRERSTTTRADARGRGNTRRGSNAGRETHARNEGLQQEPLVQQQAYGYQSLSSGSRERVYGNRGPSQQQGGNTVSLVVGIVVIVGFVLGAVLFWTNRTVAVTVNGSREKIRVNSSLGKLYDQALIRTTPGNFVSVGGNVIEEQAGYTYTVAVDGSELSQADSGTYRIHGGEQITFSDGGDRMEEYDVTYRETQPKLVFEGNYGSVSFVKQWGQVGKQEVRTGRDSGETADGDWVEELKDCIVATKNIAPEGDQKLVAITFDDGPAATYTEEYLRILEEHGAKATFFNLSENETVYPEIAQKVAASGNQLCSHTYQHQQLSSLSQEDLLFEINSAHDTILNTTGVDTTIIRPPYGDFTHDCWLLSQGCISASVIWNQDSLDWSLPGVEVIVEDALSGVQPGSIILMHDGGGDRSQDLEALPQIIERLQADGYTLVTISELMASDPDIPAEIAAGNATMPAGAVWPTEMAEAA